MKNKLKNILYENGIDEVGFCPIDVETPFNLPYAVSFTVPLSDAVIDGITNEPTHTSKYQ